MSNRPRHARVARRAVAVLLSLLLLLPDAVMAAGLGPIQGGALPGPLPLFPPDNWWNLDISGAPVDPSSAAFITFINNGGTRRLHPDFGGDVSPGSVEIYGMPYVVVDGTQPKKARGVRGLLRDESDGVGRVRSTRFPDEAITAAALDRGRRARATWTSAAADRHLLIVDRDNHYLYELYNVFYNDGVGTVARGLGRLLRHEHERPPTRGLDLGRRRRPRDPARASSATTRCTARRAEIQHAFRVTVRATNGYVYPASHRAGSTAGALPMGARLRLKAGKDISGFTPEVQKIFRAMKRYGLIVADNGSDMYISGTFDTRWDNDVLNPAFGALTASDFEVVQLGWNPVGAPVSLALLAVSPASVVGGKASTGTVSLSGPAPSDGATVTLSSANAGVVGVPPRITIGAGAMSASFAITTAAVGAWTSVTITAASSGVTRSATLAVTRPKPASLSLKPSTVTGGTSSTATVTLSGPAPAGGALVTLTSSRTSAASVPQNVTVAPGKSSASFTVVTNTVGSFTSSVISASCNGSRKSATLSIRKSPP